MSQRLLLQNQLCFPLYALSRQMTALYRPYLEPLELTYPQYLVMLLLWEHKKLSLKEVGSKLWLDSGTLTPLLKRMEETGLIARKRCAEDERVLYAELSPKGMALQEKAQLIPDNVFSGLDVSENQLEQLKTELCMMLKKIGKKEAPAGEQ